MERGMGKKEVERTGSLDIYLWYRMLAADGDTLSHWIIVGLCYSSLTSSEYPRVVGE